MFRIAVLSGLPAVLATIAVAQAPVDTAAIQDSAVRVFFDCPNYGPGCDFDFLRTEITWINWVRNREDADVHVLVTTQPTGGGGHEYTVSLIGLRRFMGRVDTLRFYATGTSTQDEERRGLVHTLQLGLLAYAATTPQARHITVTYEAPATAQEATPHDPWNAWVFTISGGTNLNGQKQTRSTFVNASINANRTTASWKLDFSMNESYSEDVFQDVPLFDSLGNQVGSYDVRSFSRHTGGHALVVKSLGPHWSAGLSGSANHSTFGNIDLSVSAGPAIEYDLYPYDQSTRRQLTVQYGVTPQYDNFTDTTIYGRVSETVVRQSITASLSVTQPWGSANASLTGSHLLSDFKQNRIVLFASTNLRLVKGLSLNLFGDIERIHDQRALPAAGATPSEILLRRRELLTSYSYFAYISLSYRFGSTLNNVVNPRFGGGGGGFFSF
ncbi:MAG TPA: hypothetical protein VJ816_03045 [Gemmatimonadales bacterium]|nr:hypothetical protein [Gemmatimonadales bacterium]